MSDENFDWGLKLTTFMYALEVENVDHFLKNAKVKDYDNFGKCFSKAISAKNEEIQSLKDQIERMKCRGNCKNRFIEASPKNGFKYLCDEFHKCPCEKWSL